MSDKKQIIKNYKNTALTIERLKELLTYNEETGDFSRKRKRRGSLIGKIGYIRADGYIQICVDYKLFLAHRLAFFYMKGFWPQETIDHKNLIKSDNRWCNLRLATYKENNFNIGLLPNNTTGYKGVSRATDGGFRATISIDNKQEHIGTYRTPELAFEAYCIRAKELHGEFLRLV